MSALAFHPRLEHLPAPELRALQGRKLGALVRRAVSVDGYYRRLLRAARVDPERIKRAEDLVRMPFSTKASMIADQEEHPPLGSRLLVPEHEVARISLSGGSSGKGRELVAHTRQDLLVLGGLQGTAFRWGGAAENETIVFNVPTINATASLAFPYGVEAVGRIKYLIGHAGFAERMRLIRTHGAVAVWGTPSTINGFTSECEREGLVPAQAFPGVRLVVVAGESYPVAWAQRMADAWGALVSEGYGSTQTHGGQCMATCEHGATPDGERGVMHTYDWSFLFEVLDPDTGEPVAPGETGELTVTTLDKRATPALRYRTGDRVRLIEGPCPCGRETALIEAGTVGRYDDMFKVKGVNVWPDRADDVLLPLKGLAEYQATVVIGERGRDEIEVRYAVTSPDRAEDVGRRIVDRFKRAFGITVRATPVSADALGIRYGDGGKARRWRDARQEVLGA
jgi:phenylacetate-CoA ligase